MVLSALEVCRIEKETLRRTNIEEILVCQDLRQYFTRRSLYRVIQDLINQEKVAENPEENPEAKKGPPNMSLTLTTGGVRALKNQSIKRLQPGEYLVSDQMSWSTCALHSIAKTIVFHKDHFLRDTTFTDLDQILLLLQQQVRADVINGGMLLMELHGKVRNNCCLLFYSLFILLSSLSEP